jgi:hypothetical protein
MERSVRGVNLKRCPAETQTKRGQSALLLEVVVNDDIYTIVKLTSEQETGTKTFDAAKRNEIALAARQTTLAKTLLKRRFELLPVIGVGAPYTEAQGREQGDSTSPTELADLITSISTMGVLQPILVEERVTSNGDTVRLLVAGERRLRAVKWGHINKPENPHFKQIPAVICPGPLSDEDKRSWQLVENLSREELKPGELAAALMFERCAILVTKLVSHAIPVPTNVMSLDNPIERFEALEGLRGSNTAAAAPWEDVFQRLGLQMSPRKARSLVAAFRALPTHLTEEMDEAHITLHTRIKFIELRKGRQDAADEIWAAVKASRNEKLLHSVVAITGTNPNIAAEEAVKRAEEAAENANIGRRAALTPPAAALTAEESYTALSAGEPNSGGWEDLNPDPTEPVNITPLTDHAGRDVPFNPIEPVTPIAIEPVTPETVAGTLTALRAVTAELAAGKTLNKYDAGSMKLLATTLLKTLTNVTG